MTEIVSPHTGESLNTPRLMSLLVEVTSEAPILAAMMKAERANAQGLVLLAELIAASNDGSPSPMTERQIAGALLSFLVDAEVRGVVARYVSATHGVPYDEAKRDLYDMRVDLSKTYGYKGTDVPMFFAPVPEEIEA